MIAVYCPAPGHPHVEAEHRYPKGAEPRAEGQPPDVAVDAEGCEGVSRRRLGLLGRGLCPVPRGPVLGDLLSGVVGLFPSSVERDEVFLCEQGLADGAAVRVASARVHPLVYAVPTRKKMGRTMIVNGWK